MFYLLFIVNNPQIASELFLPEKQIRRKQKLRYHHTSLTVKKV